MQAVALAYGRGARGQGLSPRYMDFLSLGLVINIVALVSLQDMAISSRVIKRVGVAVIAIWLAFCVEGVFRVTRETLITGLGFRGWEMTWADNLRRFVLTDDLASLAAKQFPQDVPYFDPPNAGQRVAPPSIYPQHPAAGAARADAARSGARHQRGVRAEWRLSDDACRSPAAVMGIAHGAARFGTGPVRERSRTPLLRFRLH